jgi:hypothetical protein
VDYGRPLARGRTLLGNVISYDRVWRTGANAATQFTTSAPIMLAGLAVPGRAAMKSESLNPPVEKFTITIEPVDARHGTLVMAWGPFRWTAPIVVE